MPSSGHVELRPALKKYVSKIEQVRNAVAARAEAKKLRKAL